MQLSAGAEAPSEFASVARAESRTPRAKDRGQLQAQEAAAAHRGARRRALRRAARERAPVTAAVRDDVFRERTVDMLRRDD